jgi:hypothetical protein
MVMLIVLALAFQDAETRQARELIEKLRSDRIDERDKATRSLKALGLAAFPAVKAALRDPDPEVASRAASIFPVLTLAASLPPRLLDEIPGALDAIAAKKEGAWTTAFFKASGMESGRPIHPTLTSDDLVPLGRRALQEPGDDHGPLLVIRVIAHRQLIQLKPDLRPLLTHPDLEIRSEVMMALVELGDVPDKDQVQTLLRTIRYGGPTRPHAIRILARARLKEAVPDLIRVAFEEDVNSSLVDALLDMGARKDLLDAARRLLREPPVQAAGLVPVRPQAALVVGRLGGREDLPLLEKATQDADEKVRQAAADALQELRKKD